MYFTSMLFFLASEICIELSIHIKEALYSGINKHYHGTYPDLNILFSSRLAYFESERGQVPKYLHVTENEWDCGWRR